jgi:DNA-directed RNA polymerase subunit M/transcription elongation factor TFIIS
MSPAKRWFGDPSVVGKRPIKKNMFEEVIHATGDLELVPVFPYLDEGSIVPCLSIAMGGRGVKKFQFFHTNDVPEVMICLSEHNSALRAGMLMSFPDLHGVNNFLKDVADEDAYMIVIIAIRMKAGAQNEGFVLRCDECNNEIYRLNRDIKQGPERQYYPEFHALRLYADAVDDFNASDRKCEKCGHVQEMFPQDQLGWRRYARQVDLANRARASVEALSE